VAGLRPIILVNNESSQPAIEPGGSGERCLARIVRFIEPFSEIEKKKKKDRDADEQGNGISRERAWRSKMTHGVNGINIGPREIT
jgi:hypothetical protein